MSRLDRRQNDIPSHWKRENPNRQNRDLKSRRRGRHRKRMERKRVTATIEELPSRGRYHHWSRMVSTRRHKRRAEDLTPYVCVYVVEFRSLPRSPVSCTCTCAIYMYVRGSVSNLADKNHILKSCYFETAPKS